MARTNLTVHKIKETNEFCASFTTLCQAVDAADGAEYTPTSRDGKHMLLVHNKASAAKTVTVLSGNGLQGVADMTASIPASSYAAINLESGRFKNVSGEDKGKFIIKGEDANIEIAVFELP